MGKQIKTYRALTDDLLVGDSVRNRGDFVPEAAGWESLRSYLSVGRIEEVFVDEEVVNDFMKSLNKKKPKVQAEGSTSDSNEVSEGNTKVKTTKKRTVKKTAAKTKTKKKVEENGRLTEQPV